MTTSEKDIPLKLLLLCGAMGPNLVRSKLAPLLAVDGVSITLSSATNMDLPENVARVSTLNHGGMRLKPGSLRSRSWWLSEIARLKQFIREQPPDLIISYNLVPVGLAGSYLASVFKIPHVHYIVGGPAEILGKASGRLPERLLYDIFGRKLLKRASLIGVKGSVDRNKLVELGVHPDRLFLQTGTVDIQRFSRPDPHKKRDCDFIYVGHQSRTKGFDRLLDFFDFYYKRNPEFRAFVVGGEIKSSPFEHQVRSRPWRNCVSFEGYRKDVLPYLQRSKMMLFLSRTEGLSTALMEAMACGCVPVSTDVGNHRDLVRNDETGILLNAEPLPADTVSRVSELLQDKERLLSMSLKARELVSSTCSVEAEKDRWIQAVTALMETRKTNHK